MPKLLGLALCLLVLVQCTPQVAGPPADLSLTPLPLLPTLTPLPARKDKPSVVVVTLSGARADYTDKLIESGAMPALARMSALGAKAEYLQPPDPAVAAAAQATLLTGASPARTGIVANSFRALGQALGQSASGFVWPPAVEPIWRSAMRYGLKAALVGYEPGTLNAAQRPDWTITLGAPVSPAVQHILKFADAKDWKNAPVSYSPAREARSSIAPGVDLFVLAIDSTNDQRENYDTWLLSRAKSIDENSLPLHLDEWATLIVDPLLQSSAAFKIMDANPAHFAIYQTPVMVNQIAPVELAREITRRLGAPPAPADGDAFERYWIDDKTYFEMAARQTQWLVSAALWLYDQRRPDLIFLNLNGIADVSQTLWLSDPRQPGYNVDRAQTLASTVRRAYVMTDAALATLWVQLDFNVSALLVVSDRGVAPAHTRVNLNRWLIERKWLVLQRGTNAVDAAQSKVYAETSGGTAHLYINLKGREPGGVVELADYDKLQADVISALAELADPADGQPIFARVARKQDLGALGLQNDNAGDIFAQARQGYLLSGQRDRPAVLEPATPLGASGYDANTLAMRGIFVASGAGIRSQGRLPAARALDVAPTLAALLRFTPPTTIEGKAIEGLLK